MRVLFLTQWFQPEPFFKGLPFAKALADRGHDVEVLTGFPNYPGGTLYPGYRVKACQREVIDGIIVHRVPLYPSHDLSTLRRIINYVSFSLTSFILGPWLVKKPDVIYVYNLVTLGPTAFLLRLITGARVVIDVQDLWPDSVVNSGMMRNRHALRLLNGFCRGVYQRADLLTVLSPGFKEKLVERGMQPRDIHVIYNWCDESSFAMNVRLPETAQNDAKGSFDVLFAGTMGSVQGLDTVLDCALMCKETLPAVRFILIGGGAERRRLERRSCELGLDNVSFLPPRPMDEMGELYSLADALLVHLKDEPVFHITIPSKTQAYLYAGKPIIMAVRGDAARLVRDAGAGLQCEPEDPESMMTAIRLLYEMSDDERRSMGERGYRYYLDNLSFSEGVKSFEKLMQVASKEDARGA
ncbi:MAG TPA: glycosyltransferase WbuB [Desulfobacteraceae bacterium]|nr:glycosyltransferase WbuB [Desulfobacteraceae bacterium]